MYITTKKRQQKEAIINLLKKQAVKFNCNSKLGKYPGIYLNPETLTKKEKEVIFEWTYWVGLTAFGQNPSEEMEKDIADHLFNEEFLFLVFNKKLDWRNTKTGTQRVIAFLSSRNIYNDEEKNFIHYISGICVDPMYQGYNIGKNLINESIKRVGNFNKNIALRTQNPIMKQSFDKAFGGISAPNGKEPTQKEMNVGKFLAKYLKANNYNSKTFISKKTYGSCLYGIEPSSFDRHYRNKFSKNFDKFKGDSLLCVKTA